MKRQSTCSQNVGKKAVVCQEVNKNVVFLDFVMFEVLVKNFKVIFRDLFSLSKYILSFSLLPQIAGASCFSKPICSAPQVQASSIDTNDSGTSYLQFKVTL